MEFYHEKALYTMLFLHEKAYTDASSQKRTVILFYVIGWKKNLNNGVIIELRNVVW